MSYMPIAMLDLNGRVKIKKYLYLTQTRGIAYRFN